MPARRLGAAATRRGEPLVSGTAPDPVRVLIVDDHAVVRIGLRSLLTPSAGFRIVAEAGTAADAVRLTGATRPEVVLMDVRLPDSSGIEACRRITTDHPEVRVLMFSCHADEQLIAGAVMAGATGYLLKHADAARLMEAIRDTAVGRSTFDPSAAGALLSQFRELWSRQATAELDRLTDRERRIVALIAEGYTNRAIGAMLHLPEKTVRNHVSVLLHKLGFQRRAQAAAWAGERGLEIER